MTYQIDLYILIQQIDRGTVD